MAKEKPALEGAGLAIVRFPNHGRVLSVRCKDQPFARFYALPGSSDVVMGSGYRLLINSQRSATDLVRSIVGYAVPKDQTETLDVTFTFEECHPSRPFAH